MQIAEGLYSGENILFDIIIIIGKIGAVLSASISGLLRTVVFFYLT